MENHTDDPNDPIARKLNDSAMLERLVRQAVSEAVERARKLGFLTEKEGKMTGNHPLITFDPGRRAGKPCVRDLHITVQDVLGWLASGMEIADIVRDYPELNREDILACLAYAADAH